MNSPRWLDRQLPASPSGLDAVVVHELAEAGRSLGRRYERLRV